MGDPLYTSGTEALPEIPDADDPDLVANAFREYSGAVSEIQVSKDEGFAVTVGAMAHAHSAAIGALQRNISNLTEAVEASAKQLNECGTVYLNFRNNTINTDQGDYEDNRQEALRELRGIAEEIETMDLNGDYDGASSRASDLTQRREELKTQLKQFAKDWDQAATDAQNEIAGLAPGILSAFDEGFGDNSAVAMNADPDSSFRIDRDDLLVNMFGENAGVLEIYAHSEDGIADSRDAINLFNSDIDPNTGLPTPEVMEQFVDLYGTRMWQDPYFANYFAQEFGADKMAEFTARVSEWDIHVADYIPGEKLAAYQDAVADFGGAMMIATGSMPVSFGDNDTRADLFHEWNTYAGKLTFNDQSLEDWRKDYQQSIIDVGRATSVTPELPSGQILTDSMLQGYDVLGQMWGAGAAANPEMVWSDEFLNGYNGQAAVGHDLMAWDHEHQRSAFSASLDQSGLYGITYNDQPISHDAVQNLLEGMDMTVPPISASQYEVYDGVRDFLASDTTFDVETYAAGNIEGSVGKLNMAEYLVGHRFDPREGTWRDDPQYTWLDKGDALGSAMGAATFGEGAETPEGATIASGFIDGYSYGLAHNDLTASGLATDEISFGDTNSALRSYSGTILGPYMADIAMQMQQGYLVDGADPYIMLPNGEVTLALSNEQVLSLISADSGIFSDLARDVPFAQEAGRPTVLEGLIEMSGQTMASEMESAKRQLAWANELEQARIHGGSEGYQAKRDELAALGVDVNQLPSASQAQAIVDRLYDNHGEMYMHLETATGEALMAAGMEQDRANQIKADVTSSVLSLGLGRAGKVISDSTYTVWQATEIGKQFTDDVGGSVFSTDNLSNAQDQYKNTANEASWSLNQMDTAINQRMTLDPNAPADQRYAFHGQHSEYSDTLPEEYQFIAPEGSNDPEFDFTAENQSQSSLQREQQLNYYNTDPWLNGWLTQNGGNEIENHAEQNRDSHGK